MYVSVKFIEHVCVCARARMSNREIVSVFQGSYLYLKSYYTHPRQARVLPVSNYL